MIEESTFRRVSRIFLIKVALLVAIGGGVYAVQRSHEQELRRAVIERDAFERSVIGDSSVDRPTTEMQQFVQEIRYLYGFNTTPLKNRRYEMRPFYQTSVDDRVGVSLLQYVDGHNVLFPVFENRYATDMVTAAIRDFKKGGVNAVTTETYLTKDRFCGCPHQGARHPPPQVLHDCRAVWINLWHSIAARKFEPGSLEGQLQEYIHGRESRIRARAYWKPGTYPEVERRLSYVSPLGLHSLGAFTGDGGGGLAYWLEDNIQTLKEKGVTSSAEKLPRTLKPGEIWISYHSSMQLASIPGLLLWLILTLGLFVNTLHGRSLWVSDFDWRVRNMRSLALFLFVPHLYAWAWLHKSRPAQSARRRRDNVTRQIRERFRIHYPVTDDNAPRPLEESPSISSLPVAAGTVTGTSNDSSETLLSVKT